MRKIPIALLILALSSLATYSWTTYTSPTGNNLNDVEFRSTGYGWIGGANFAAKYVGGNWQITPVPGPYLNIQGISAINDERAFAVAPSGVIIEFNGTSWDAHPSPTSQDLNDVYMVNWINGWAVGYHTVLRYTGTWSVFNQSGLGNYNWMCIWANGISNVWIGGSSGEIIHYGGSSFAFYTTPTTATITGIWFTDPTHGWACTDTGEILSGNGSIWTIVSQPGTTPLNGICIPSNGFAVGNSGRIMKYHNGSWTIYPNSPTTQNLNALSLVSDTYGFAVGNAGTVLKYGPVTSVEPASIGELKSLYR